METSSSDASDVGRLASISVIYAVEHSTHWMNFVAHADRAAQGEHQ